MTRTLKRAEIERLAHEVRSVAGWLYDHAEAIAHRANADRDDALRSTLGGGANTPGHSDPTASTATSHRYDPAGLSAMNLLDELRNAKDSIRRAERNGRGLLAIPQDKAELLASEGRAGAHCDNCRRWVKNTIGDELRRGLCNACRVYEDRNGRPRPPELYERDPGH